MMNYPVSPLNPNIALNPNGTLPDDTDRVSSLVGCNVNQYVFGDTNKAPQGGDILQTNPINQTNSINSSVEKSKTNKKSSALLGALALVGISVAGFAAYRVAKGKPITKAEITKLWEDIKKPFKSLFGILKKTPPPTP